MKPMSEKQIAQWETQRAKGKWLFVAKNTLILCIVWLICALLGAYFYNGNITRDLVATQLVISLVIAALLNLRIWANAETNYQSFINDKTDKDFNQ